MDHPPSATSGFFGNIGEGAIVIVGDRGGSCRNWRRGRRPAVIIVISDRHAKTPALIGDAGFIRDVREGAIVIVVKEGGTRRRFGTRLPRR